MKFVHIRRSWPVRTVAFGALAVASAFGLGAAVHSTLADVSPIPPTAFKVCISEKGTWRALPSFQQCKSTETLVELALHEDVLQLHTDLLGLQAQVNTLGGGGNVALQAQVNALTATVNALSTTVANGDADLQADIAALQAQLTALEGQVAAQLSAEALARASADDDLQAAMSDIEAHLSAVISDGDAALQAQLQSQASAITDLVAQNNLQANQIATLSSQLSALQASVTSGHNSQQALLGNHENRISALEAAAP